MIRNIIITLLLFVSASALMAENMEKKMQKQYRQDIETVRSNIKNGKDLDKTEGTVRKYLGEKSHEEDIQLRVLLCEVIKKSYSTDNEKVYLKSKVDTASLMKKGRRMFLAYQALDSLDMKPNGKGVSVPSYRKKNAEFLLPYRKNLLKAALFFYEKDNWEDAWQMAETYLDCKRQPIFSGVEVDSLNNSYASYIAFMSAYNKKDYGRMKIVAEDAMEYDSVRQKVLQLLAEVSLKELNAGDYIDYIKRGFKNDVHSKYFFPRIIDYYVARNELQVAQQYADEALETDSTNTLFLLAKHVVLMSQKNYQQALEYGIRLLGYDDSLPEPNYDCGYIYYQMALKKLNERGTDIRTRTEEAKKLFRQCLPYMEKFRSLSPKDRVLWKPVLYDVYLNLNMGKEFAEIEKE